MYISDPHGRMLGLHLYQGIFTVIPLVQSPVKRKGGNAMAKAPGGTETVGDMCEPAPIRLAELSIVSMTFLDAAEPTVAMIYEDSRGAIQLKVAKVKVMGKGGRHTGLARDAELENIVTDEKMEVLKSLDPQSRIIVPVSDPIGM